MYVKYKRSDKNLDKDEHVSPKTQKRKYMATEDSCLKENIKKSQVKNVSNIKEQGLESKI